MAIYSLSTKPMSRSAGRSAVAAAAYRSGTELADERTDVVHDYTRKRGVEHAEIVTRDGVPAPKRETLWNQAEAAEKRRDARVAREYLVALPHELDADQRLALARELAGDLSERYGVAVDMAIHAPDRDGDERNHHAHLLATTRAYGHDGLGEKVAIEWSDRKRREAGLERGADEVRLIRQRWETMANAALERAEVTERVDCRSLADQGIDRVPQIHVGPMGTEMIRRGTPELSDRATLNLEIQAVNLERHQLQERAAQRAAEREAQEQREWEEWTSRPDVCSATGRLITELHVDSVIERERALPENQPPPLREAPWPRPEPERTAEAEQEAEAPRPRPRQTIQQAAAKARERIARREAEVKPQPPQERRQEPPKVPPGPSPAVRRIDAQIDTTRRELREAQQHSGEIGGRMLEIQMEARRAAEQLDSTQQAAQVAAQAVKAVQAEVDSLGGLFKRGKRREAQGRLDAAQERRRSAQEAAQAAKAHHATLNCEYGQLREQAAPAGRQVEKLEGEYQRLQRQRTAQIEREQRPQVDPQPGQDAWSREAAQQRQEAPQRDAWATDRSRGHDRDQGSDGPELG